MAVNTVKKGQLNHFLSFNSFYFIVYIDVGDGATDSATLSFDFTGTATTRTWDIKVTQIPCNSNFG